MTWKPIDEIIDRMIWNTKRCHVCDTTYRVYTFTILPSKRTEYYCLKHAPKFNKRRNWDSSLPIY